MPVACTVHGNTSERLIGGSSPGKEDNTVRCVCGCWPGGGGGGGVDTKDENT